MMRMSVITPSFAPDFELCAELNRSVLKYLPSSVHHHIIVPRSDLKLFAQLAGATTHIRCESRLAARVLCPCTLQQVDGKSGSAVPSSAWLDSATGGQAGGSSGK